MAKKTKKTLDQRIEDLKKQQEEVRDFFNELRGAVKVLEQLKNEKNEKTD